MQTQRDLFLAFFRIGLFGFGGGPSMIPLFKKEVVERYQWMTDDEFSDVLAIGNTLPGPIATKMAGYVGYRMAGLGGCINAVVATIVPLIIAMIAMLTLFTAYQDKAWVSGMGQGVIPIVAYMMVQLTWDFFDKSCKGMGLTLTVLIGLASFGAIWGLGVSPGLLIAGVLIAAILRGKPINLDTKSKELADKAAKGAKG